MYKGAVTPLRNSVGSDDVDGFSVLLNTFKCKKYGKGNVDYLKHFLTKAVKCKKVKMSPVLYEEQCFSEWSCENKCHWPKLLKSQSAN